MDAKFNEFLNGKMGERKKRTNSKLSTILALALLLIVGGVGGCYASQAAIKSSLEQTSYNDPKAQWQKGNDYYLGRGVAKDYTKAVKWYRKTAEQGLAEAKAVLKELGY